MSETIRTTISISREVADLAAKVGDVENRNFSNLCEVALKEYAAGRVVRRRTISRKQKVLS